MVETVPVHWKIAIIRWKAGSNGETFHVVDVVEPFPVTGVRTEVHCLKKTGHARCAS